MSMPVQNLLFANLAPSYHFVPPPLTTEFLERSSFDVDERVMEMTPQGYQNYHNRKFSETLHACDASPRNIISFAELRPRVHA